jgi:glucose-1-phosphate cytidylyltransferase
MKVVLFCGGLGMRLRDYSDTIPKPMVPIGNRPVLWHVMKYYAAHGHTDFVLCLGYKGDVIKQYFLDYEEWRSNDFVLSHGGARLELMNSDIDDWRITFADTGLHATIGERLRAVRHHLEGEEMFLANYSDGLTDLHLPDMVDQFRTSGAVASFVCVRPSVSFHMVDLEADGAVQGLTAASEADVWVNGGFFALRREIFDVLHEGDELVEAPFRRLIARQALTAYPYTGFWSGMDTFKDRQRLEEMHDQGQAVWEVWKRQPRPPVRQLRAL